MIAEFSSPSFWEMAQMLVIASICIVVMALSLILVIACGAAMVSGTAGLGRPARFVGVLLVMLAGAANFGLALAGAITALPAP